MKRKSKISLDPRKRVVSIVLACASGILIGIVLAVGWGENFRPRTLTVERFGTFHRVPLPKNVSSRDDINAFEVELKGADDFAQISVNNYIDPNHRADFRPNVVSTDL